MWINGERRLTVFFGEGGLTWLKSWGDNIHADMEEGVMGNILEEFRELEQWLLEAKDGMGRSGSDGQGKPADESGSVDEWRSQGPVES